MKSCRHHNKPYRQKEANNLVCFPDLIYTYFLLLAWAVLWCIKTVSPTITVVVISMCASVLLSNSALVAYIFHYNRVARLNIFSHTLILLYINVLISNVSRTEYQIKNNRPKYALISACFTLNQESCLLF